MNKRTHKTCAFIALKQFFFIRILKKSFIYFWPHLAECEILVLWPGLEPVPPAVEVQSLNHWTARDAPLLLFKCKKKKKITVNCLKFTIYEVIFFMLWLLALPKYKFVCLGTSRNLRGCGSLQGDHWAPDTWWAALLSVEKQGILVSTTRSQEPQARREPCPGAWPRKGAQ